MPIQLLIFFAFSAALITAALMTIMVRNPVHSALFLVMAFFASAGLWIMLEAEFLGLVLILVYVGAVMTLFLFVVMTLNIDLENKGKNYWRYLPYGILVFGLFMAITVYVLGPSHFTSALLLAQPQPADYSNVSTLGSVLYTDYVYPFEIAGVLLLVAIIAAISLSFRGRQGGRKSIAPEEQITIRREDRIRIVKMSSEKKK